jgi:hypothetical protein
MKELRKISELNAAEKRFESDIKTLDGRAVELKVRSVVRMLSLL